MHVDKSLVHTCESICQGTQLKTPCRQNDNDHDHAVNIKEKQRHLSLFDNLGGGEEKFLSSAVKISTNTLTSCSSGTQ